MIRLSPITIGWQIPFSKALPLIVLVTQQTRRSIIIIKSLKRRGGESLRMNLSYFFQIREEGDLTIKPTLYLKARLKFNRKPKTWVRSGQVDVQSQVKGESILLNCRLRPRLSTCSIEVTLASRTSRMRTIIVNIKYREINKKSDFFKMRQNKSCPALNNIFITTCQTANSGISAPP